MKIRIWPKKLKDGTSSLYLDIDIPGKKRRRETLDLRLTGNKEADEEKMRMAEIVRARREIELFSDVHAIVPVHRGDVHLVDYLKSLIATRGGRSGLAKALPYIEGFFGNIQLKLVSELHLANFQRFLQQTLADSTVETYFSAFNAALNQAVRENYLTRNPAFGIEKVHAKEAMLKSLTEAEVSRLLATPIPGAREPEQLPGKRKYGGLGARLKRAFEFSLNTGLRWSDLKLLKWKHIRGNQIELPQRKTGAPAYVPMNRAAWALINPGDRIPPAEELVFGFTSKTNPDWYLERWGKAAGLPFRLGTHVARHTFARRLLEKGVDVATVQQLLVHRDLKTTMRYVKASSQAKRSAVDMLDDLAAKSKF